MKKWQKVTNNLPEVFVYIICESQTEFIQRKAGFYLECRMFEEVLITW